MAFVRARGDEAVRGRCRSRSILVLAFAVVAAGCGGGSDAADDVAARYPSASEYQLELLEGGVTWAEYEKAAIDMVACMKDQGVAVTGPTPSGNGFSWNVTLGVSEVDVARVEAISVECEEEYFGVVSHVY